MTLSQRGKKGMKSTSKTNDGFEIVPFHTLLPQPGEEARDERRRKGGGGGGGCAQRQPKLFQFHRQFPV